MIDRLALRPGPCILGGGIFRMWQINKWSFVKFDDDTIYKNVTIFLQIIITNYKKRPTQYTMEIVLPNVY